MKFNKSYLKNKLAAWEYLLKRKTMFAGELGETRDMSKLIMRAEFISEGDVYLIELDDKNKLFMKEDDIQRLDEVREELLGTISSRV